MSNGPASIVGGSEHIVRPRCVPTHAQLALLLDYREAQSRMTTSPRCSFRAWALGCVADGRG
eukprot:4869203-Prymnesium_polylepis.1